MARPARDFRWPGTGLGTAATSRCAAPAPPRSASGLADVQAWAAEWERAGRGPLRVEYRQVGGRLVGTNQIPCRAWLDGYDQAWELLGRAPPGPRLTALADRTKAECPRLAPLGGASPGQGPASWPPTGTDLLATVRWIDERQHRACTCARWTSPASTRSSSSEHKGVLTELLDLQLDPDRIDVTAPDFEGRYGFRRKPDYVRFRTARRPALATPS